MFAERGFDGTTTRDIAARAGVNLGLIKYYYDGKEKLWKAAVDEVVDRLWRSIGTAVPDRPLDAGRLAGLIRACVRFAARNPAFIRLMNDECKRNSPRMRWLVDRHGKQFYDVATALLERARALGHVPDVGATHLYYMFVGAIGMIFSQAPECRRLTGTDPTASDAAIEAHADSVVTLFLGRRTSGRRGAP
jgi:AcrR family transcriptional regulator